MALSKGIDLPVNRKGHLLKWSNPCTFSAFCFTMWITSKPFGVDEAGMNRKIKPL